MTLLSMVISQQASGIKTKLEEMYREHREKIQLRKLIKKQQEQLKLLINPGLSVEKISNFNLRVPDQLKRLARM